MVHSEIAQTPVSRALGAIRKATPAIRQSVSTQLAHLKDSGYLVSAAMTGVWLLSDLMEDWSPAPVLWFSSGSTEAGEFDVRDQSHMNTMLLAADCADTGFDSLYLVNNREHLVLCRSGTTDPKGGGIIRAFGNRRVEFVVATRGMERGQLAHNHSVAVWESVRVHTTPARRVSQPLLGALSSG